LALHKYFIDIDIDPLINLYNHCQCRKEIKKSNKLAVAYTVRTFSYHGFTRSRQFQSRSWWRAI